MILKEALDKLLNKYHLEDWVYEVRDRAREGTYSKIDWDGNSWDHPDVKEFSEICKTLETWLKE